jgi:hypothetical protein
MQNRERVRTVFADLGGLCGSEGSMEALSLKFRATMYGSQQSLLVRTEELMKSDRDRPIRRWIPFEGNPEKPDEWV